MRLRTSQDVAETPRTLRETLRGRGTISSSGFPLLRGRSSYGKVDVGGRQVKRRLGRVRISGSRDGLTKVQAVAALRKLHDTEGAVLARGQRAALADAGKRHLDHLAGVKGRKPTAIADDRRSSTATWGPFVAGRTVDRVTPEEIAAYVAAKLREELRPETVRNHAYLRSRPVRFRLRKGWASANPVRREDLREVAHDDEIRLKRAMA